MALVELGLSREQFHSMTPAQMLLMQLQDNRKKEHIWEHTRQLLCMIHNASMGTKRRLKPTQIIKLSTDKKHLEHPEYTKESAEELLKRWKINN